MNMIHLETKIDTQHYPICFEYIDGEGWDEISHQFKDIVSEQTHCFNQARWGDERSKTVIFKQNEQIIGGASVIILPFRYLASGIAIVKWGPIINSQNQPDVIATYVEIIKVLKAEFAKRLGLYLTIMPAAEINNLSNEFLCDQRETALHTLGFKKGVSLSAPERYWVNVSIDAKELRKSLTQKWRSHLKKSEKNQFEFELLKGQAAYDKFMPLYQTMLNRKKFNDHSAIHTLQNLVNTKNSALQPHFLLVRYDGILTAAGVFDMSGSQASYLYGATNDKALGLRSGYAMHWWIAQYLCDQQNIEWYDLGGNDNDAGLHQFKKSFVGKRGEICLTPANYHYSANFRALLLGIIVFKGKLLKDNIVNKLGELKSQRRS